MKYRLHGKQEDGETMTVTVDFRDLAHAEDQAVILGMTDTVIEPIPASTSSPKAPLPNRRHGLIVGLIIALMTRFF